MNIICERCGRITILKSSSDWVPYYYDETDNTEHSSLCPDCALVLDIRYDTETTEFYRN